MTDRDENGRFIKGSTGNTRGRMPKERETKFYEITLSAVTFDDWREIINKAKDQAKRGDAVARKFLADYLMGPPVQKSEIAGKDGGPVTYRVIYENRRKEATDASE